MNNLFNLNNFNIIVTGGSRGIGLTISKELSKLGANVFSYSRKYQSNNLCHNGTFYEFKGDVLDTENYQYFCSKIMNKYKKIDALVNNAGITLPMNSSEDSYSDNSWNDTIAINLTAAFKISTITAAFMKLQNKGSIINITSIGAELAFPNNPAYLASKGGLKMLTKSLALDLGKFGITCNNLGPGYIKTNMTSNSYNDTKKRKEIENNTILNRWGLPADIVGPCAFLISDASRFITAQDIYVDGGWTAKGF